MSSSGLLMDRLSSWKLCAENSAQDYTRELDYMEFLILKHDATGDSVDLDHARLSCRRSFYILPPISFLGPRIPTIELHCSPTITLAHYPIREVASVTQYEGSACTVDCEDFVSRLKNSRISPVKAGNTNAEVTEDSRETFL